VDGEQPDLTFATACDGHNSPWDAEYCNLPIVADPFLESNAAAVVAECYVFEFAVNVIAAAAAAAAADSIAVVASRVRIAD